MANTIGEGDRNLIRLNYTSLLTAILEALKDSQANQLYQISKNDKQLLIDIDEIAYQLATTQENKVQIPFSSWQGAKISTTNLTELSKDDFADYNRKIRDRLQQLLESFLKRHNFNSIESYLKSFWTNLSDFQKPKTSRRTS